MRVVFLEDVAGVAQGGDVKEVKNGFARNYLIPKSLAVPATHNALQRVERLAREAGVTRVKHLEDMTALAAELDGFQVEIDMRAGSGGRLYGSVTNVMIAEALAELTDREIDRRIIELEEPIRQMGTFEVNIRLDPEVEAKINVLVYPTGTDPRAEAEEAESEDGESTEADAPVALAEDGDSAVVDAPVAEAESVGSNAPAVDEPASDGEADTEADEA